MKKIPLLLLMAFMLVSPFALSAQSGDDNEKETHVAVPPVPGLVVPFVSMNVENQFYRPLINGHRSGAGQFSSGFVVGTTFRIGWEEHGGGLSLISVGYYRQEYGAHSDVVQCKRTRVSQGLYLSIDADLPIIVPGLSLSAVFSAGRFGALKHRNILEHPFYQPNDIVDMSSGFEGFKISYKIGYRPSPTGKVGVVFEPAIAFGYSGCYTTCVSLTIRPMKVKAGKAIF